MESHENVSPRIGTTEPFTFQTQQEASLHRESLSARRPEPRAQGQAAPLGCGASGVAGESSPEAQASLDLRGFGEDGSSVVILKMLSNESFCERMKC